MPISRYLAATAAVSAVAVRAAYETKGIDLAAIDIADARRYGQHRGARSPGPRGAQPTALVDDAV